MERALALRDVMDHAVKVHQETTDVRYLDRPRRRMWITLAVCVPLLALSAYSWFARPELIWGPRPGSGPALKREANIRLAMFLLSRRLIAYRTAQGNYPPTLAEVGERTAAIGYRLLGDTAFELRSGDSANVVVLRSTDNPATFLGNTANVINASR